MLLVVGLGNPGTRYTSTRHNVGFRFIDLLAKKAEIRLNDRRAKAVLGEGRIAGHEVVLAKPRTFMNNSGEGIQYLMARFGGRPSELLIVYDEMALPTGRIRLRMAGSHAGHNGIRSIISAVQTDAFPRSMAEIHAAKRNPTSVVAYDSALPLDCLLSRNQCSGLRVRDDKADTGR